MSGRGPELGSASWPFPEEGPPPRPQPGEHAPELGGPRAWDVARLARTLEAVRRAVREGRPDLPDALLEVCSVRELREVPSPSPYRTVMLEAGGRSFFRNTRGAWFVTGMHELSAAWNPPIAVKVRAASAAEAAELVSSELRGFSGARMSVSGPNGEGWADLGAVDWLRPAIAGRRVVALEPPPVARWRGLSLRLRVAELVLEDEGGLRSALVRARAPVVRAGALLEDPEAPVEIELPGAGRWACTVTFARRIPGPREDELELELAIPAEALERLAVGSRTVRRGWAEASSAEILEDLRRIPEDARRAYLQGDWAAFDDEPPRHPPARSRTSPGVTFTVSRPADVPLVGDVIESNGSRFRVRRVVELPTMRGDGRLWRVEADLERAELAGRSAERVAVDELSPEELERLRHMRPDVDELALRAAAAGQSLAGQSLEDMARAMALMGTGTMEEARNTIAASFRAIGYGFVVPIEEALARVRELEASERRRLELKRAEDRRRSLEGTRSPRGRPRPPGARGRGR